MELMDRTNADRRAQNVVDLACMSFLIEKGLANHEQLAERLQEVQKSLPDDFRLASVTERIDFLRQILSAVYGQNQRGWNPVLIQGGLSNPPPDDDPEPR